MPKDYQTFKAKIYKLGINPCVDVPKKVSDSFNKNGFIPVKGKINNFSIRATLVPKGDGFYRLYINGEMRRGAGVDVGDVIKISILFDKSSRDISIPNELTLILKSKNLYEKFMNLTPSRRKEILVYRKSLKTTESMKKNIKRIVNLLKNEIHP